MNQVSRPMQIALGAVMVFAVLWFAALRPKDAPVEPVAATPSAPAAPESTGGPAGAIAKTVNTAKDGAAAADASVKSREGLTGEDDAATNEPDDAAEASADAPAASTPAAAPAAKKAAKAKEKPATNTAQARADRTIRAVQRDLKARRAVVVLVWAKRGREDKILHKRIKGDIDRHDGKVRTYYVPVSEVGRYDGLLSGLSLGQIPSTIVIAPNNQAKVLGGLTSIDRIDRLTSGALQTKPVAG